MSAVLTKSSGREPQAGRLGGEIPPSRPAQLKLVGVVSREDRLRIWGHLSQEEKQRLRKLVDAALRAKEGIDRSGSATIRERCAATNSEGRRCQNWARNGEYCAVHARRMVA